MLNLYLTVLLAVIAAKIVVIFVAAIAAMGRGRDESMDSRR